MKKRTFLSSLFALLFGIAIWGALSGFSYEVNNAGNYTTEVTVYKDGSHVGSGYKVTLEFVGSLSNSGFTDAYYTNSDGVAYVKHASQGEVKVYVDGNWSNHRTKGRAPGKISVYL